MAAGVVVLNPAPALAQDDHVARVEGKLLKGESFHNKRILAEATHPVTTRKAYVRPWEEKLKLKARHDICLNFTHFWWNKLVSFFN